jgi:hypothetical protein
MEGGGWTGQLHALLPTLYNRLRISPSASGPMSITGGLEQNGARAVAIRVVRNRRRPPVGMPIQHLAPAVARTRETAGQCTTSMGKQLTAEQPTAYCLLTT